MIPAFDYLPRYRQLKAEIDAAMQRVIASGRVILGPEVRAFEEEFAGYVGVPHAVGVASGTDALVLALRALGVGSGDEVITVASAGVAPVAAVRAAGATPRFVDVDPATLLLDPARLEHARTRRTRCIVPVHLYGRPVEMEPVMRLARQHDLHVVEDCAQAHGARYGGSHVGGLGHVSCFSFYPTKNLGAYGDGGLCATRDETLRDRLRELRMYGFRDDRHAHCEGSNSRLDELQAAILRVKLRHLDEDVEMRRSLAERYLERLGRLDCELPASTDDRAHAYHLFVVQVGDRPRALQALEQAGIGYGLHYAEPVHLMEAYRFLGLQQGDLPITERGAGRVVSLPLYPGLTGESVDRVTEILRGIL